MVMAAQKPRRKKQIGVSLDPDNLEYIEHLLAYDPIYRRRSRSDVVNMLLEAYRKQNPITMPGELFSSDEGA